VGAVTRHARRDARFATTPRLVLLAATRARPGARRPEVRHEDNRMSVKPERDIEKSYPRAAFVAKLRRLADAIEKGDRFVVQIAGERIHVPGRARFNIEHERSRGDEEIEFQIKWKAE
jgi:amphi-Trp domain-containing protein